MEFRYIQDQSARVQVVCLQPMASDLLYEFHAKRPRISPDVVEILNPHFSHDLFDLGVSAHMRAYGLDVKSPMLVDASLPANVDKESEVMALSLPSSASFEEALAFLDISNCEDRFGEAQADELKIIKVEGI